MTSRRPMIRSFSGNGRLSSYSEDEGSYSNGRTESRKTYISDVRPENRSTLCSIMAQLTEDIQPSFDTTLKSKAVSENCNVKFTCVVSGYPAPELKWYKDDMELDRYCGLPKYEIRRNGKFHSLHIYNCTLDDAAIYQVSASNSKGIVSCSGVLEVGIMNEYMIHQRFFSKLKLKAEKKKKELEEQMKMGGKGNIQKEKPLSSPERSQRKRPVPSEEIASLQEATMQKGAAAETNGVTSEVKQTSIENGVDKVNSSAKKKMKIANGIEVGINSGISRSHVIGKGSENCYDGGFSLAQFLAETLQSQEAEEQQNLSQGETSTEVGVHFTSDGIDDQQESKQKEECERETRREQEFVIGREKGNERQPELPLTVAHTKQGSEVKHHSKVHKDHEHHNLQTSISSMLHTVKDFFFGKSKKVSREHTENQVKKHYPARSQTPPSFQPQSEWIPEECKPLTEHFAPVDRDKSKEPSEITVIEQSLSSDSLAAYEHEDSGLQSDLPQVHELLPESIEDPMTQRIPEVYYSVEDMEVSVEADSRDADEEIPVTRLQVEFKAGEKTSEEVEVVVPVFHEESITSCLVVSTRDEEPGLLQMKAPDEDKGSLTSLEDNQAQTYLTSAVDSAKEMTNDSEKEMQVNKTVKEGTPDTKDHCSPNELCDDEKAEVKLKMHLYPDIESPNVTELSPSLEDGTEACDSKMANQVLSTSSDMAEHSADGINLKAKPECTLLVQEMSFAFPPTAEPQGLEMADLKMLPEHAPATAVETTEVRDVTATKSSLEISDEDSQLKDALMVALEENLEVNLFNEPRVNEAMGLTGESAKENNESLQTEMEMETTALVEAELMDDGFKNISEANNEENNAVSEEHSDVLAPDVSEKQFGYPTEKIPQIQISTIEDVADTKLPTPDLNLNEHIIIPKTDIMELEFKECTVPLTILALDKQESEGVVLQKNDATDKSEGVIQDYNMSGGRSPTQKGMPQNLDLSPPGKVKEVAQLEEERESCENAHMKSSEQLPQEDSAEIPLINVSCTDDKGIDSGAKPHVSDTPPPLKAPSETLFVMPPISVTCHESVAEDTLSSHREWIETESSPNSLSGIKHDVVDDSMNTKPEKPHRKHRMKQTAPKCSMENTPAIFYEMPRVGDSELQVEKTGDSSVPEILKTKSTKIESLEDLNINRSSVERLGFKTPTCPTLSPTSLRKFLSKSADLDLEAVTSVPVITVGDRQSDKGDEDVSEGSTPTSSLSCETSPRLKRRDSLTLIRSATPEELASGARRKIFIPKAKDEGEGVGAGPLAPDAQGKKETAYMSPSQARRAALLQAPAGQNTPPMERRSPLMSRRKSTLEVPKVAEETHTEEPISIKLEEKPAEKKLDPLKAPQVIRKIRGEPFPDASGHLKLWCQFFNVLSDSTIKWYKDEEEILEVKRSGGDETQVALAIVLASSHDCAVYGCTITNEYGTDTTDFLLSVDILSEILLRDDLEVGEEIEMTPMLFTKGLADCGSWGDKYFGRIMTEAVHLGEGCAHKASRVKVIYGLDPIFESGSTCIMKVQSPIAYGTKHEMNLAERNQDITKQECKVQNMIREYCKIFAAETRAIENFGYSLEVIPQYLMYRPANSVPYATVEADIEGVFQMYCMMEPKGKLISRTASEVEQKCCTFQHWIHQWTHGNLLVTWLEGVGMKLTNIRVVTKSKGYQGLSACGSADIFEQFLTHHQCNYYCGLLGLRPLKTMESLQQPAKMKGSKSPLLNRKMSSGSVSPQIQRKGIHSPQALRKTSPKVTRKVQETEDNNKADTKTQPAEMVDVLEMR
ncbi:uncharacterized protein alpk3a [Thalassophryne amazonica]|uniref:uncharacterized protein alpk3a n=1 Tax=Thalassophryne amazonica TaxID=390379 RepID=UPI0014709E8C|nr:uncharacterized protein alpk3a [Thalassophryne amazonica]